MKNKTLKQIIFRERLKNEIINIILLLVVFVISYLFNRFVEMLIFVFTYSFIRMDFIKAIHGDSFTNSPRKAIWICRIITFGVQLISIIFIISFNVSRYVNILFAFLLGVINYFVRDWKDKQELLQKKLESLTFDEMKQRFPGYTEYDLKCVYAYINRGSKNADNIAMKYNYSTRQIQRMIKKMREGI